MLIYQGKKKKETKNKERVYVRPPSRAEPSTQEGVGLGAPVCRRGKMGITYHRVDHSTSTDFVYFAIPFHAF